VAADHLPLLDDGSGIVNVATVGVDKADYRRDVAHRLRDPFQLVQIVPDKLRLEHQIFGRVPGDGELGESDDVGFHALSSLDRLEHAFGVLFQPANDRISFAPEQRAGFA